jgi:hypothetical protein
VLVAVLLLIALATVLIVTTSGVSQIERKAVSNSAKEQIAKQNALFALQVALGQLQSAAGPDQRVTATADILNTNPAVAPTVANPYWTGVWKTGTNALDVGFTPQRTTSLGATTPTTNQIAANATAWLVSGATNYNTLSPTVSTVSPLTWSDTSTGQTNSVVLAQNYGTNPTYQTVRVPLIQLTNTYSLGAVKSTNVGSYAYWVSDEGVKSKANQGDTTIQSGTTLTYPQNLLHFVISQANNAAKGLLGVANIGIDLRAATNALPKVNTIPMLQFVTNTLVASSLSGTNASLLAAEATTYSQGVLCDVMRGGLKKDLTAAFEDSGASATANYGKLNPSGTNRVFTAGIDTIGSITTYQATPNGIDGLRWLNLYYFYNLYKSVLPTTPWQPTGGLLAPYGVCNNTWYTSPTGAPPYTVGPNLLASTIPTLGNNNGGAIFGVLSPIVLGERWDVSVAPTATVPQLKYYFQFTLYNPYAVAIKSSANNFRLGRALSSAGNYLETAIKSKKGTVNYYYTALNDAATLLRNLFATSFQDTQVLQPGEIRVFGLSSTANNMGSVQLACQVNSTATPFGLVSMNASVNANQNTALQYISTLGATGPADTYTAVPFTVGDTVTSFQLCTRPTSLPLKAGKVDTTQKAGAAVNYYCNIPWSQFDDCSLQGDVAWQTATIGVGGSILGINGNGTKQGCRYMIGNSPSSITLGANPIPANAPSPLITAFTTETPLMSIYIRKKGINKPTDSSYFANSANFLPLFCGNSIQFNIMYDRWECGNWEEVYQSNMKQPQGQNATVNSAFPPGSSFNPTQSALNYLTTSWGDNSLGLTTTYDHKILCDIPTQPMLSLGQFMHLQAYNQANNSGNYVDQGFGTMFTGGSYASPEVPLNQTVLDTANGPLSFDSSFLANQALFDKYFFSTVPPATLPTVAAAFWTALPAWTAFNAANTGTSLSDPSKPFLNTRIKPYYTGGTNPPLMADLRDMDKAAANLILDGAFNVNSTSVNAWKALLSSLAGNDVSMYYSDVNNSYTASYKSLNAPIFRFWSANGNGLVNARWSGVRDLTDLQLTALAQQIVNQVKTRGPFLSMADFLNRRLAPNAATNTDIYRAGALQAAIDNTILNSSIKTGNPVTGPWASAKMGPQPIAANMKDASSSAGSAWDSAVGMPGYLMQQDLVQCFSPTMTVRSDTFVIRVYGECRNPATGKIDSMSWGEAIVQRTPEFMDQTDPGMTTGATGLGNATAIANLTSSTNINLGRRFKVVSFRWLNPNEI